MALDAAQQVLFLHELEPVGLPFLQRAWLDVLELLPMIPGAGGWAEGEVADGMARLDAAGIWL